MVAIVNSASALAYREDARPVEGATGTIITVPVPGGRKTCMPGPGGGLVYVRWDDGRTFGASRHDLSLVKSKADKLSNIGGESDWEEPQWVVVDTSSGVTRYHWFSTRRAAEVWNAKYKRGFVQHRDELGLRPYQQPEGLSAAPPVGETATVLLIRYSPWSGDRVSETRVSGNTLRAAVRAAVLQGYASGDDFTVVPDDHRPDSPGYWYGKHFDHVEGDEVVRHRPYGRWNLNKLVNEAIEKKNRREG